MVLQTSMIYMFEETHSEYTTNPGGNPKLTQWAACQNEMETGANDRGDKYGKARREQKTDQEEGIAMFREQKGGGAPVKKYVFICYSNSFFIDDS